MTPTPEAIREASGDLPPANILATLLGCNSFNKRRLPATDDVHGCVRIPIMDRAANSARPLPYSKPFLTFRATDASAFRTSLGSKLFRHFDIFSPVRNRFITELVSQHRPSGVVYGLGKIGFRKARRANVPYYDLVKIPHYPGGNFMKMVAPLGCDFHLNLGNLPFLFRPLRFSETFLRSPVISRGSDSLPGGENGQIFQSQIYAHLPRGFAPSGFWDINDQIDIPTSRSVLREIGAIANLRAFGYRAREPDVIIFFVKPKSPIRDLNIAAPKRNPAKIFSSTKANKWPVKLSTRTLVSFTYPVQRGGQYAKLLSASGNKLLKIVSRGPSLAPFKGMLLGIVAKIPNKIYRARLLVQSGSMLIFYPEFVGDVHPINIAVFNMRNNQK